MAEKILMIPADVCEKGHKDPWHKQEPLAHSLESLENSMRELLDANTISDYDKVKLLNFLMQRYKTINDHRPQELLLDRPSPMALSEPMKDAQEFKEESNNITIKDIVKSIPSHLQKKSTLLLEKIQNSNSILGWDKLGHLIVNGQTIPTTNITDLVHDVVKIRSGASDAPEGWEIFTIKLKELNVPRTLLRNEDLWGYSPSATSSSTLSENTPSTSANRVTWSEDDNDEYY